MDCPAVQAQQRSQRPVGRAFRFQPARCLAVAQAQVGSEIVARRIEPFQVQPGRGVAQRGQLSRRFGADVRGRTDYASGQINVSDFQ